MEAFPIIQGDEDEIDDSKSRKSSKKGFQAMGLSKGIFGALMRIGFRVPTPIQKRAIPVALSGGDVVAMARTGSGKTASFVIPMLERLKSHSMTTGVRGLCLAPTRELALQSYKFTMKLAKFTDLRSAVIVGGESLNAQFSALASNPDIIVATPGRLCHLLKEIKDFSLARVEFFVLDEADRLFEMGFAEQIDEIMSAIESESRQTMLVSATMPKVLAEFTHAGLKDPSFVRLDADTKISPTLRIGFFQVRKAEKPAALMHLIREVLPYVFISFETPTSSSILKNEVTTYETQAQRTDHHFHGHKTPRTILTSSAQRDGRESRRCLWKHGHDGSKTCCGHVSKTQDSFSCRHRCGC